MRLSRNLKLGVPPKWLVFFWLPCETSPKQGTQGRTRPNITLWLPIQMRVSFKVGGVLQGWGIFKLRAPLWVDFYPFFGRIHPSTSAFVRPLAGGALGALAAAAATASGTGAAWRGARKMTPTPRKSLGSEPREMSQRLYHFIFLSFSFHILFIFSLRTWPKAINKQEKQESSYWISCCWETFCTFLLVVFWWLKSKST